MAVLLLTEGDEKYCGKCGKRIWRPDVKGEKKSFLVSYCKCSVDRSILDNLKAELPQRASDFGISGEYLKESRSVTKSISSETVWTAQRVVKSKKNADVTRAVNRNTSSELVVSKDSVVKTAEKEQDLYLVTREIRRVEEESSVVAVKKDHHISVLSKPFATHKRIVLPPQTRVPSTLTKQRQSNFSTFRRQAKRQLCYGKPPSGLKLAGNISIRMKGKCAAGDSACDEQLSSTPLLSASDNLNNENSDDSHSRSRNQTAKHRHNMMLSKGGQLGARLLTRSAYRRPQAVAAVSKVVGQSEARKPASTSHRPRDALAHMTVEGKDECGFKEKRTAVTKNSSIYYETESKGSGCSSASPHSKLTSDTADITRSAVYCHEELESTAEDECGSADTSGIEDIKQGLRKCWRSVRKGKTAS